MVDEYWEWDGETHLEDTGLYEFLQWTDFKSDVVIKAFCDLFHFKGCCNLTFNGEKVRAGDRIYKRSDDFELVRGDTEPFICPVHNEEHKGTGPFICIATGEFM